MVKRMVVIHGPNLNLLGQREPNVYGRLTLEEINDRLIEHAEEIGVDLRTFQSNGEGEIIDAIHEAGRWADGWPGSWAPLPLGRRASGDVRVRHP